MKVNKNGWLFKLHSYLNTDCSYVLQRGHKVSLCEYFWVSVAITTIPLLAVPLLLLALISLLYALVSMIMFLVSPFTGWYGFDGELAIWCVGTSVLVLSFYSFLAYKEGDIAFAPNWIKKPLSKVFESVKPTEDKKPKKLSIIVEYYKAHKDKWCPRIELEGEDK